MMRRDEDILNRRWQLRGSFTNQVKVVLRTVRMSPREVEDLQALYHDVVDTFSEVWPDCALKPFGSVVMGLALKNSDVDCMLAGCGAPPSACVETCRRVVSDRPGAFLSADVKHKRIPTVTLVHARTGRQCELSFSGPLAVEFGRLAGHLLGSDPRALRLAVLVKCWAKTQRIVGPKWMPSSALIILIIFFLQERRILPPVATLQENRPPRWIDAWNAAFAETAHEPSDKETTLRELLGGFFEYYERFDFRNKVVCPYLGRAIERRELVDPDSSPPEFQLYERNVAEGTCEAIFTNCVLCIQDPFQHSRNCVGHLRPAVVREVFQHFARAAHVCRTTAENGVLGRLLSFQYDEPRPPAVSGLGERPRRRHGRKHPSPSCNRSS